MIWILETLQSGSLIKEEFTLSEPFIEKFEEYHNNDIIVITATSSSYE